MRKVEVWQTTDNRYWHLDREDVARAHQDKLDRDKEREAKVLEYDLFIKETYVHEYRDWYPDLTVDDIDQVYFYTEEQGGWKCEDRRNPIDLCVYVCTFEDYDDEETCVFCGQPEERK